MAMLQIKDKEEEEGVKVQESMAGVSSCSDKEVSLSVRKPLAHVNKNGVTKALFSHVIAGGRNRFDSFDQVLGVIALLSSHKGKPLWRQRNFQLTFQVW